MGEENVPVVILCGGRGLRLRGVSDLPKPLAEVGGVPILWHVMSIYAREGFRRFILCTGYGADLVRAWFADHEDVWADWEIVFSDAGVDVATGERLRRAAGYLPRTFFLSYADGVTDLSPTDVLRTHRAGGRLATMTCVRPSTHYGVAHVEDGQVVAYEEKRRLVEMVNGGFFCLERGVIGYVGEGETLEREPLQRLVAARQLGGHVHDGFWHCMDTPKDHQALNDLWSSGRAPWTK